MKNTLIYRFKIELEGTEPAVWRTIDVPAGFNFWDLHVAIQDSMGWLDYHLHCFSYGRNSSKRRVLIGIPDGEFDDVIPCWETYVSDYFFEPGNTMIYEYDFGDGWLHKLTLTGIILKEKGKKYPNCVDGKMACPPEDCGGLPGYYRFLEILKNRKHEEYEETIYWLKNHAKNYYPSCFPQALK